MYSAKNPTQQVSLTQKLKKHLEHRNIYFNSMLWPGKGKIDSREMATFQKVMETKIKSMAQECRGGMMSGEI